MPCLFQWNVILRKQRIWLKVILNIHSPQAVLLAQGPSRTHSLWVPRDPERVLYSAPVSPGPNSCWRRVSLGTMPVSAQGGRPTNLSPIADPKMKLCQLQLLSPMLHKQFSLPRDPLGDMPTCALEVSLPTSVWSQIQEWPSNLAPTPPSLNQGTVLSTQGPGRRQEHLCLESNIADLNPDYGLEVALGLSSCPSQPW